MSSTEFSPGSSLLVIGCRSGCRKCSLSFCVFLLIHDGGVGASLMVARGWISQECKQVSSYCSRLIIATDSKGLTHGIYSRSEDIISMDKISPNLLSHSTLPFLQWDVAARRSPLPLPPGFRFPEFVRLWCPLPAGCLFTPNRFLRQSFPSSIFFYPKYPASGQVPPLLC